MPPFAVKVMRSVFSVAGRLSPHLASRLAFELFCRTPSRRPAGDRARTVHADGMRRLDMARRMPFRSGKARVMAYRFNSGPSGSNRRFLVVHGWGASAAYMAALAEGLASDGSEVTVLDFPGHGASSGRRMHMRMAVEVLVEAERLYGPFDGVVGHSFGGASLMLAAGGVMQGAGRIRPGRIAVIGAPTRIKWLFDDFSRQVGLTTATKDALVQRAERMAGAALGDFDTVPVARHLQTPLLVIHAEDDKEVYADHARRYANTATATIRWANGYGHRRIIGAPEVIASVRDFMLAPPENRAAVV